MSKQHTRLTAIIVSKENKHGRGWKRIKTFRPSKITQKAFPWIEKVARYKSKEGFIAEYNFSNKNRKWSLGAN